MCYFETIRVLSLVVVPDIRKLLVHVGYLSETTNVHPSKRNSKFKHIASKEYANQEYCGGEPLAIL